MTQNWSAVARPRVECRCRGDAREMGYAQGLAARPKVAGFHQVLRNLEAFRLKQPAWLPYRLFLRVAERQAAGMLLPALRSMDSPMLARLEGIAEGAGLPLRTLCLLNAMEAFLSMTEGVTAPALSGCCSALAIRGMRARSSEPALARNFDYLPQVKPFFILRESHPRNGLRSLEFTTALHAGAFDGINEKGLAITQNYAFVSDSWRPAPLVSMLISAALAVCGSVQEATEFIATRNRWGAGILALADASGDLAMVELSNTRTAVRRPPAGEDWVVATNVCTCPEVAAVQVPENATYSDGAPRALRGVGVLGWHSRRAHRIRQLVEAAGVLGIAELSVIMAEHGPDGVPGGATPCVHTDYWSTCASMQWFPAHRSARVSYGSACRADYVEVAI